MNIKVIKRDGTKVQFDIKRLMNAVQKALNETKEGEDHTATFVLDDVINYCQKNAQRELNVEEIQDRIELEFMRAGLYNTAKAFILYRQEKTKVRVPKILLEKQEYIVEYPQALEFCRKQEEKFWTSDEIDVEKDIQDLRVNMTESERHGVITVLKLFTKYELHVGNEYWGTLIKSKFKRPEFERMAATFSFFELGVHAPFYAKINQALFIDTEEFYNEYKSDKTLSQRMEFISQSLKDEDLLYSLAVFAMLEGAVLYTSFAFLKHFQSNGKNLIANICAGINFSVRDELLHHEAGAWLFRTLLVESKLAGKKIDERLFERIEEAARIIFHHENEIINRIFAKGEMSNIDQQSMVDFVAHRLNVCLRNLGMNGFQFYEEGEDEISKWFYKGIESYIFHDFFAKQGREYTRKWNEKSFTWNKNEQST